MTRRRRIVLFAALGGAALLAAAWGWVILPLPDGLVARPASSSLTIQDRYGLTLRTTRAGDGSRTAWLPLSDMDPQLIQAFVALEDHRFYRHPGVDPRAAARALVQDLRGRQVVSGASTISMQLARLLRHSGRGWLAKAGQAMWALRLERHLDKQQILEQYLNRVPLGQGAVGVPAAAALYLDASATHLSLGQAALLAGLASAPSADNPFVSPERAANRRRTALRRMIAAGYISADAAEAAANEPPGAARRHAPFLAPHFTTRILQWAEDSGAALEGTWRTSLDLSLQAELEGEVRHTVTLLRDREVRQAAVVVLDNRTGEVLAWVGSPDFDADTAGQVDMVVSPRQPGSALKPFLYAAAFDHGFTAASVLPDIPRTYQTASGPYQPRNYDRRYHGPVLAREALASSFNVPAVELTDRLGATTLLHTLHEAGFASLGRGADHYGLGLALGNGDVSLLELANGYRGLAAGGRWRPWRWLAAAPVEAYGSAGGRPFASRGAALLVLDILADPVARIPGFGVDTPFDFPFQAAVKTGTSHHFTDNWAVGVTAGFTVAVWAGNFSGRPMRQISGVTGAGPLLHRAMLDVARRYQPGSLESPAAAGAVRLSVCRLSGLPAGARCLATNEWFLPGTVPSGDCTWHGGGGIAWPAEYGEWARTSGNEVALDQQPGAPRFPGLGVPAHVAAESTFRILSPLEGDRYQVPPGVESRYATIPLRVSGSPGDWPVRWWVDGRPADGDRWALRAGTHEIRAVAASGRADEVTVHVR